MKIQDFITKAIEGGWGTGYFMNIREGDGYYFSQPINRAEAEKWLREHPAKGAKIVQHDVHNRELQYRTLLDPEAWKAVGKVEGWKVGWYQENRKPWHYKMLLMIDSLCEGKSIEQYLETL